MWVNFSMSVKTTGSLDQALNRLVSSNAKHVQVGVIDNSKYPDGTSVASVAFWNEYGTRKNGNQWIPPRPFFRDTIKNQKDAWANLARQGIKAGYSIDKVLGLVGAQMQTDIQYSIMTWTSPPNSAYTVAKKKFNAPLRDSLLMHDSIKFEISEDKM